eukprot:TRINITY_DN2070_c3_g1_i1.p1 TRINITY_DN2070_c3_g1~~TRINITY_DN2070_c3_g1_i1.p1  ORF type:complete len:221 (-),score=67.58 TRINITY_DN2070_c3_g1_i1:31-693(-)
MSLWMAAMYHKVALRASLLVPEAMYPRVSRCVGRVVSTRFGPRQIWRKEGVRTIVKMHMEKEEMVRLQAQYHVVDASTTTITTTTTTSSSMWPGRSCVHGRSFGTTIAASDHHPPSPSSLSPPSTSPTQPSQPLPPSPPPPSSSSSPPPLLLATSPSSPTQVYDVAVVGGGIIGLATAREILHRHPSLRVCVLEKEMEVAQHQSKNNSGVIHCGIYYQPG